MTDALKNTLRQLGVRDGASYSTIAQSPPSPEENRRVYEKVNFLLDELLPQEDLGRTVHVTGELRALSDPLHQAICAENYERHHTAIRFIGRIPERCRREPYELLEQNAIAWRASWRTTLRAFEIPGDAHVEVYATAEREQLHYSVFPNNYVLLQEPHDPEVSPAKHVWLLQSAEIRTHLDERNRSVFARAQRIEPAYFRRLATLISHLDAIDLLARLADGDNVTSIDADAPWYRAIRAVGLVSANGSVVITDAGREYLQSYDSTEADEC